MEKKIIEFLQLKKQVDFLVVQVTEKKFEDLYIYINNVFHLMDSYQKLNLYIGNQDFRDFLAKKHKDILIELYTTGKVILGLLNFIKVMQYEELALKSKPYK